MQEEPSESPSLLPPPLETLGRPARLRLFLSFAALSGAGWLLDAALLLGLVGLVGMPPAQANVISSCTAALTVFLVSRQRLFTKASHHFALRVVIFVSYSLTIIFIASWAVQFLVRQLAPWLATWSSVDPTLGAAALAKVIVTPPQLMMNFFMSRFLSERPAKGGPPPG